MMLGSAGQSRAGISKSKQQQAAFCTPSSFPGQRLYWLTLIWLPAKFPFNLESTRIPSNRRCQFTWTFEVFFSSPSTSPSFSFIFYSSNTSANLRLVRSNISFVNFDMAAVNMQMMQANMPLDFLPLHSHTRSDSVSSSSTHSSSSRPQSAHGVNRMGMGLSPEEIYRASYHLGQHNNLLHAEPVRIFVVLLPSFYWSVIFLVATKSQYHKSRSQKHPSS